MRQTHQHGSGTYLIVEYPWGLYRGGSAICPDGKIRRLKRIAICADTFFSIPASVAYRGKTVSGYVSVDENTVTFHPVHNRKNSNVFTH